jgi:hypothetical protein
MAAPRLDMDDCYESRRSNCQREELVKEMICADPTKQSCHVLCHPSPEDHVRFCEQLKMSGLHISSPGHDTASEADEPLLIGDLGDRSIGLGREDYQG